MKTLFLFCMSLFHDAAEYLRNALNGLISGVLFSKGPMGAVGFNVDRINAHGLLEVRSNSASGGHTLIAFAVSNPAAMQRKRLTGRTVMAIMTAAMIEGYDPIRIIIDGRELNLYGRSVALAANDLRSRPAGTSFCPQRVATPAEAGQCLTQLPEAA